MTLPAVARHSGGGVGAALAGLVLSLAAGCGTGTGAATGASPPSQPAIAVPAGFPAFTAPDDNAPSAERIALGRRLFYDERLSRTEEVSCSSCHVQAHAFSDPNRFSTGVDGQLGKRNAPALVNLAWGKSFFWHGGASSLEVQAVGPIKNPLEMDMSLADVAQRLSDDAALLQGFKQAYDDVPNDSTITRALASFGRSLVSGNSAYDRYAQGDDQALSAAAVRGEALFNGERAECFHCHTGFNFTNNGFRNNGNDPNDPDEGRREVTLKDADLGKFKIPTLRNVAVSAPYMHDGALATLDEVIDAYVAGGRGHPNTDPTIVPLDLTTKDKADLRAFLESLTDDDFLKNPAFTDPDAP